MQRHHLLFGVLQVFRGKAEDRARPVFGIDHIDDDEVVELSEERDELVAYGPGLLNLDVGGKGGIREGVDQVDAESVVSKQDVAYA